ncbi:MAG TPA: glycosyltransferase, partial [bacterium]|nr:glycosyltransferase [bacterium]
LMAMDIHMVILGTGAAEHQEKMRTLAKRYCNRLHVTIGFDNDFAKLIYAGSDAFLMPSKYEPCGLGQLIAMKYGTLPIVHSTGGLADTVRDIDANQHDGNGFTFDEYSPDALVEALGRAVTVFRKRRRIRWKKAVEYAMSDDLSWRKSAKKYIELYKQIGNRTKI